MYTELDRLAQLEFAEQRGEKKGLEKGRAEGIAEGCNARSEEIARKMKGAGYPADEIARITGLSEECVLAL